jgi:hypothetical protein
MFLSPLGERLGEGVVAREDYDANRARELRRDGSRAERKVWELLQVVTACPPHLTSPQGGEEFEEVVAEVGVAALTA